MQRIRWIMPDKKDLILRELGKAENSIIYYGTEIGLSQKRDFNALQNFSYT